MLGWYLSVSLNKHKLEMEMHIMLETLSCCCRRLKSIDAFIPLIRNTKRG